MQARFKRAFLVVDLGGEGSNGQTSKRSCKSVKKRSNKLNVVVCCVLLVCGPTSCAPCFLLLAVCSLFLVFCFFLVLPWFVFLVFRFLFPVFGFWLLGSCLLRVACCFRCLFGVCCVFCPLCVVCCWLLCVVCYWVTRWYTGTRLAGRKSKAPVNTATTVAASCGDVLRSHCCLLPRLPHFCCVNVM